MASSPMIVLGLPRTSRSSPRRRKVACEQAKTYRRLRNAGTNHHSALHGVQMQDTTTSKSKEGATSKDGRFPSLTIDTDQVHAEAPEPEIEAGEMTNPNTAKHLFEFAELEVPQRHFHQIDNAGALISPRRASGQETPKSISLRDGMVSPRLVQVIGENTKSFLQEFKKLSHADGCLYPKDFPVLLEQLNQKHNLALAKHDAEKLYKLFDPDGDGDVEFNELTRRLRQVHDLHVDSIAQRMQMKEMEKLQYQIKTSPRTHRNQLIGFRPNPPTVPGHSNNQQLHDSPLARRQRFLAHQEFLKHRPVAACKGYGVVDTAFAKFSRYNPNKFFSPANRRAYPLKPHLDHRGHGRFITPSPVLGPWNYEGNLHGAWR